MLLLLTVLGFVIPRPTPALRVAVEVADSVELPSATRRLLMAELASVFDPLEVQLSWRDDDEDAPVWLRIAARPAVRQVTRCRRGLHDHRLAVARLGKEAGTGRVELWVDHVAHAVSGNWDRLRTPRDEVMGRALGRVLAHELGHILLRQLGHDEAGIMQSSLSARDLIAERSGFTDAQRAKLARALAGFSSSFSAPITEEASR